MIYESRERGRVWTGAELLPLKVFLVVVSLTPPPTPSVAASL